MKTDVHIETDGTFDDLVKVVSNVLSNKDNQAIWGGDVVFWIDNQQRVCVSDPVDGTVRGDTIYNTIKEFWNFSHWFDPNVQKIE